VQRIRLDQDTLQIQHFLQLLEFRSTRTSRRTVYHYPEEKPLITGEKHPGNAPDTEQLFSTVPKICEKRRIFHAVYLKIHNTSMLKGLA
jgi:hypothetical protein